MNEPASPSLAREANPYQPFWLALLKSAGFALLFTGLQVLAGNVMAFVFAFRSASAGLQTREEQIAWVYRMLYACQYEIAFASAGVFLLAAAMIYLLRRRSVTEAVGLKKTSPLGCAAALFLGFGAFLAAGYLIQIMDLIPAVHQSSETYQTTYRETEEIIQQVGRPWVGLLYTVIGAPVTEEILCRGLILRQVRRTGSEWAAILVSGLAFAIIHGNIFQMVFTLPLGILLGYVAVKLGSVLPSILLHAAFNASNYIPDLLDRLIPRAAQEEVPTATEEASEAASQTAMDPALLIFFLFLIFSLAAGVVMLVFAVRGKERITWRFRTREEHPALPLHHSMQTEGQTMAAPEFLIVGLGNPGERYASTRHNAGFLAMDYLALRENLSFNRIRFRGLTAEKEIEGHKLLFLKPQTFMNLSGESVREAAAFYHIPPEKILVLVDDVNFEPGTLRIRRSGSDGGHNGLKSIIACLSSDAFPRVRLGVGHLPPERDLVSWVLGALPDGDMDKLIACFEDVLKTVRFFAEGRLDDAMSAFNGKTADNR